VRGLMIDWKGGPVLSLPQAPQRFVYRDAAALGSMIEGDGAGNEAWWRTR
jgi:hypothetical protein